MALIEFQNVTKQYFTGVHILNALDNVSFSIEKGEFIVILGPSGAGKSTLLNLLGGMESATKGAILVDGKVITDMNAGTLTKYRATDVGFVFQFYNLIPTLTALENVELVRDICPGATPAVQALEQVGLLDHKYQFQCSSAAVSNSVCLLPEPSARTRKCSFATNQPAHWTVRPAYRS